MMENGCDFSYNLTFWEYGHEEQIGRMMETRYNHDVAYM